MPRIPDVLLESVVYLFQNADGATAGRGPGGTGFVVDRPGADGQREQFVVSNIHVVFNGCTTLRVNTDDGSVPLEISADDWASHPDGDDVAVARLPADLPATSALAALRLEDVAPTAERMWPS